MFLETCIACPFDLNIQVYVWSMCGFYKSSVKVPVSTCRQMEYVSKIYVVYIHHLYFKFIFYLFIVTYVCVFHTYIGNSEYKKKIQEVGITLIMR